MSEVFLDVPAFPGIRSQLQIVLYSVLWHLDAENKIASSSSTRHRSHKAMLLSEQDDGRDVSS